MEKRSLVFEGSLVIAVFLTFLQRLIQHAKDLKAFLIVDGHPFHRAKSIKEWLRNKAPLIEHFYSPGDSPEPNLDELLNQE
jgi:hypothetical protein